MLVMQDIEMEQLRQETDELKKDKIKQEHEFKEEDKKIKEFAAVQKTKWEKKAEEKAIADMMEENELKIEAFMKLEEEREQTRLYRQKKKEEAKTAFEDIKRQY
uniref:Trichohyalin-plectin-homology domain-containing protein n=1 Tax=Amphimedon queenslandica TaxID=400682 RepID=A0A1X7UM86_AMPQE